MIPDYIVKYLQTDKYKKNKEQILIDLDTALANIKSKDILLQKRGEKRLSYHARRELGFNCLPVREWFLRKESKEELYKVISQETGDLLISELLRTLIFFYEQYIIHPAWDDIYDKSVDSDYQKWLLQLIENFIDIPSGRIQIHVAYSLALLGDERAWDIFANILKKRASTINWIHYAVVRYAKDSIKNQQKENLIKVCDLILSKTKNLSVKHDARSIKEICEGLKTKE